MKSIILGYALCYDFVCPMSDMQYYAAAITHLLISRLYTHQDLCCLSTYARARCRQNDRVPQRKIPEKYYATCAWPKEGLTGPEHVQRHSMIAVDALGKMLVSNCARPRPQHSSSFRSGLGCNSIEQRCVELEPCTTMPARWTRITSAPDARQHSQLCGHLAYAKRGLAYHSPYLRLGGTIATPRRPRSSKLSSACTPLPATEWRGD